ncbi:6-bladed beta-propeller [Inmirania thermothiophila]|uniref:6-bladed beta-propeller protein n=1 Tax=Inmirania thermothiophila TaxID=1750597 RepID=A0A3N1Y251_9GAMM|nr:6-bladed beta-propeller [Inmirania thermothiophila]ROR32915.1 6-bladed beta-propeller protein [Inmirania thermothiophila]
MARSLTRWPLWVLLAGLLAGCAETRQVMRYGVEDLAPAERPVWPPPPEVPRFLYAGALTGEDNLVPDPATRTRSGAARLLRWLVGLGGGRRQPRVLQRPVAVATDAAGRILVSDMSRQGVWVFDPAAASLALWRQATPTEPFEAPAQLAVAADGTVFVADAELGVVARLDAEGRPGAPWGRGVLVRPTGVAWDPKRRRLYVADTHAHDIKLFDAEGRLEAVIGERGTAPGRFNFPTHLAFRGDRLYVADTMNARIEILDPEGRPLAVHGERGLVLGSLVRPKGVAVDDEGRIYVVESYYDRLLVFDAQWRLLLVIGGTGSAPGRFYLPAGLWIDPQNRIYIADMFNGRVVMLQFLGE